MSITTVRQFFASFIGVLQGLLGVGLLVLIALIVAKGANPNQLVWT